MSRKSHPKPQPQRQPPPPVRASTPTPSGPQSPGPTIPAQVAELHRVGVEAAIAHADMIPEAPLPATATSDELRELVKKAHEARQGFDKARQAVEQLQEEAKIVAGKAKADAVTLADQRAKLEQEREAWRQQQAQDRAALAADRKAWDSQLGELVRREEALKASESKLGVRETSIAAREAEAAAGFSSWRAEQSAKLSAEVDNLRRQGIELADQGARDRQAWADEEIRLRTEAHRDAATLLEKARQDARREVDQVYAEREARAAERDGQLRRREAQLRADQRLVAEAKEDLDAEVEARVAHERAALQAELQRETARRQELEQAVADFRTQSDSMEGWAKALGEDPASAKKRLKDLQNEIKNLNQKLDARPLEGTAERLEQALAALDETRRQLEEARIRIGQLQAEKSHAVTSVNDVDTARREVQSFKASRDVLAQRLEDLQREVERARSANAAKSPFEACSEIEATNADTVYPATDQLDLTTFCHEVRHRLAEGRELYFSDRIIRTFVAGLASSKLVLLEGISGTGKTSLPLAMADVLGMGAAKVEVQAGWRDRQDLFGHYNTFERRFQETKFLKALVRAGTNRFKKLPMFIVLDEMNLSHPEQYFADVLSALEGGDQDPAVELLAKGLESAPNLLRDGKVRLFPNTWFIGTANQDETTKDFADKTYDRSHAMWLPRHHDTFSPKRQSPRNEPLGLQQLQDAFLVAERSHRSRAKDVVHLLELHLGSPLEKDFGVGWGNRLERQIHAFVPAYVACGGTVGEAVDHLIFSKLVRKVRGRHDVAADDMAKLQAGIIATIKALDPAWLADNQKTGPRHDVLCLEAIDKEGRRLAQGSAWASWWEAR